MRRIGTDLVFVKSFDVLIRIQGEVNIKTNDNNYNRLEPEEYPRGLYAALESRTCALVHHFDSVVHRDSLWYHQGAGLRFEPQERQKI